MTLLAKKPELVRPSKPKMMISGASGIGKTMFSLDFPSPYLIDTEGGATREAYTEKLSEVGGVYLGKQDGSQDFRTVNEQIKELATEKHNHKTLIIDSFSHLFMMEAAAAEEKGGSAFGRDKKEAVRPTRQMIRWLEQLDMNVILICHSKDKWEGKGDQRSITGTTFDGWEKLEYIFDLWIEIVKPWKMNGGGAYQVKKSRIEEFEIGSIYPLSYAKFADLYGREIIEKEVVPIQMAFPESVERLQKLLSVISIPIEDSQKWLEKVDADQWEELTEDQIQKCISFCEKKLKSLEVTKKETAK